jgi:alpha-mannosidase
MTIHLIANAHLDPVWLWDWREGLNEGIQTCRTVLDLMDEFPALTFIRGEAAIYEHIEQFAPEIFARITAMIEAGRWDVVGGTYIQPDTNLTGEVTLRKHFERGLSYFQSHLGVRPTVAWAADSFGHSAGLPNILADAGMQGFAFTRPYSWDFELPGPPFWWEGDDGRRVLAYRPEVGVYLNERTDLTAKLDSCLEAAQKGDLSHIGCFYGIGNHGGGPTRRHLQDIKAWQQAHPEVEVVHSGLHRLFNAFLAQGTDFPTYRGELNFCLRGCYSAAAAVKFAYRRAEAAVERAESLSQFAHATTQVPSLPLDEAWDAVLFNSFHDILPGTSIERALDEQLDWLGGALHQCRRVEAKALSDLATHVQPSVPRVEGDFPTAVPFLIANPESEPFNGLVELEACLDYRPLFAYQNREQEIPLEVRDAQGSLQPSQVVATEHDFLEGLPWRARVLVPVALAPREIQVLTLGYVEEATTPPPNPTHAAYSPRAGVIANQWYEVAADAGASGVMITCEGRPLIDDDGLRVVTVSDEWGTWGGMNEEKESLDLSQVLHEWKVERVEVLETGPLRSRLWVRMSGGNSWMELVFSLEQGRKAVDVAVRVLWNERAARLKITIGQAQQAEFQVPGGTVTRGECGEVPGGRWVRLFNGKYTDGFASDALYNFDLKVGLLRATIVRASRFACDRAQPAEVEPWRPTLGTGELRFRFLLAPGDPNLSRLANWLEKPVVSAPVAQYATEALRAIPS